MLKKSNENETISNKLFRYVLIGAGTVFLGLGIVGLFLPILPTTPFVLLAAACYARSSKRFYNGLMNNRWFGSYIKNYHEGRGIPVQVKIVTLTLLWVTLLTSIYFIINTVWIELLLMIIGIGVTIHILTIKTYRQNIR
ncbi:MAG: YbaN family protein [Candidatus Thermoplasmatota archaeon]|nr:YbaN family protein [Candidatus Thermoplasmatota archaeon]